MISNVAAHVRDLVHAFRVLLHEVDFVRVSAVDRLNLLANIVTLRVVVLVVSHRSDVARRLCVRVGRENLRESVTHLELAVERSVEGRLSWVETAVLAGTLDGR